MYTLDFERPLKELRIKIEEMRSKSSLGKEELKEINQLEKKAADIESKIYSNLGPWEKTKVARHPNRPGFLDFVDHCVTDFIEVHGDREFRDDPSIVAGFGKVNDIKMMLIGTCKGSNTKENLERNFGMPHPEGYRKAERLMLLAEKFNLPIFTIVDTPGAYPGIEAEERNQSGAIASSIQTMVSLKVPVVSLIFGEGGSGGAIALAMGNVLMMMTNSYYSVISPEGCASILWGDGAMAQQAAQSLKFDSESLKKYGIVDEVIPEGKTAAHFEPEVTLNYVKDRLVLHLKKLKKLTPEQLVENRYAKYRAIGAYENA